jgi:aminocarboxymuconate-semialdehyde decarboxylase
MVPVRLLVDVHTHVYLPRYASLLRARTSVPRILPTTTLDGKTEERMYILDNETSAGRPVGSQVKHRIYPLSWPNISFRRAVLGPMRETQVYGQA